MNRDLREVIDQLAQRPRHRGRVQLAPDRLQARARDLSVRRQTAILMATHDLHEAAAIASRVFILLEGELRGVSDAPFESNELEQMLVTADA